MKKPLGSCVSERTKIGDNVTIGENVEICDWSKIGNDVTIGDDVTIGNCVTIESGVSIGKNCQLEDNVIVGYSNLTKKKDYYEEFNTTIGNNCLIRAGAIIYKSCKLGENNWINNYAILRENTIIGNNTTIGSHVMCEGSTRIGNYVSIYSFCGLGGNMIIEDKVFLGTNVVTANNPKAIHLRGPSTTKRWEKDGMVVLDKGPTIRFGARIGISAILLADIEIGREAMVAAGAIVTKDVPPFTIVRGIPAKTVGTVPENERFND